MQTIRDLGVLRYQIGNEAIKAVIEYLPSQYNKRTFESKPTRAAYVVEQRVVYSIYYKDTLVLPGRGERGVALAGCVWVRVE